MDLIVVFVVIILACGGCFFGGYMCASVKPKQKEPLRVE